MYRTANGNPCDAEPGSPVRLGHVPSWTRNQLLHTYGPTRQGYRDGRALFEEWGGRHGGKLPWIDHWGSTVIDVQPVVVSEPYLQATLDFSDLHRFAASIGCRLVVDEKSYWYPGKTLRLAFVPAELN
jgi:hypothetical protein